MNNANTTPTLVDIYMKKSPTKWELIFTNKTEEYGEKFRLSYKVGMIKVVYAGTKI